MPIEYLDEPTTSRDEAATGSPLPWYAYGHPLAAGAHIAANTARSIYNDPKGALQTADDAVRAAANAVTFGMADRLAGAMPGGGGTDAQVKLSEQARERSPYASLAGDVGGAVAIPQVGAEALAARAGRHIAPWAARALGYGASGAATGAAQGAGNTYTGNAADYARNAVVGGVLGGVLGGVGGAALGRRPDRTSAVTPTTDDLWRAKTANYQLLENSPATYDARALANVSHDLENQMLTGTGNSPGRFHWRDSPTTWAALDEMRQPAAAIGTGAPPIVNATVDPAGIEFIRKGINSIPRSPERSVDRTSGRVVKNALDDFMANPPPGAVVPGTERDARIAAILADRARQNNAAYKRSQWWEDIAQNAENTAGATHSGSNLENEYRKAVRSLLKQTDGTSQAIKQGFNANERQAMQDFARGTRATNALRFAGKALGGGGGLGMMMTSGVVGGGGTLAATGDPRAAGIGALAAAGAGKGLTKLANRRSNAEITRMGNMIRQRSPEYLDRVQIAPMFAGGGSPAAAKMMRDAVTLELLKQSQTDGRTRAQPNRLQWE